PRARQGLASSTPQGYPGGVKRKWPLLLGVAAAAAILPAGAAADSATFGSTLQATQNTSLVNTRAVQLATATPTQLVAPADGLITNWAVRSGDVGATYELAVIHHPVNGSLDGMVTAIDVAFPPVPDSRDSIRQYNAVSRVVVDKGDSIGLASVGGPAALPFHNSGSGGDVYGTYGGGAFSLAGIGSPTPATGKELLVQANEHFCR